MRLLVSVATAADARAAVEGGADIVDAKDPKAGALGAVPLARLREIRKAVAESRPLTAALGDAATEPAVERMARDYAEMGATLVKIGLLGTLEIDDAIKRVRAAVRGASTYGGGVVAVAYADATARTAPSPAAVIEIAARAGAGGVLIDTIHKDGPGLLGILTLDALRLWTSTARRAGLLVAVAGKVTGLDLDAVAQSGADVVGVRGAVCSGGRGGHVCPDLVRKLVNGGYRAAQPISAPMPAPSTPTGPATKPQARPRSSDSTATPSAQPVPAPTPAPRSVPKSTGWRLRQLGD